MASQIGLKGVEVSAWLSLGRCPGGSLPPLEDAQAACGRPAGPGTEASCPRPREGAASSPSATFG